MSAHRQPLLPLLFLLLALLGGAVRAEAPAVRVAVLDNAPPMSFRDGSGKQTGFSHAIIQAICEEMRARCEFQVITLDHVIEALAGDEIDIGAVSLLETPERRDKILFAKPYFRSISLWFAKPDIAPGQPGVRVAVVKGSAQERYAQQQNWPLVTVATNGRLIEPLASGAAQAAIIPMSTAISLQKEKVFMQLGLESTVMTAPELGGPAAFGINPRRPDLKEAVDAALDRIKRNGVYDRINTQFLPFRVN